MFVSKLGKSLKGLSPLKRPTTSFGMSPSVARKGGQTVSLSKGTCKTATNSNVSRATEIGRSSPEWVFKNTIRPFVTLDLVTSTTRNKTSGELFIPLAVPQSHQPTQKKGLVELLENNGIDVVSNNAVPLVKPKDMIHALDVLKKEKVLVQALSLYKKEGDIFFEIYWKKGLHLDNAIREVSSISKTPKSASHIINFCNQKCTEFVEKMEKEKDISFEYYGIVTPQ